MCLCTSRDYVVAMHGHDWWQTADNDSDDNDDNDGMMILMQHG